MNSIASKAPNALVSRILQVALGLFVTTSDLPSISKNMSQMSFDCSFETDCRWQSDGRLMDHWRIARGEPDSLLWLAATGTLQLPREPFALIETRGSPADVLSSDVVTCQKGYADFSFLFWTIGDAGLEVCLSHENGDRFNCTGPFVSKKMPEKVSLIIPQMQQPFKLLIVPLERNGVLVVDDIRYNALPCESGGDIISNVKPITENELITRQRPETSTGRMIETTTTTEIETTTTPQIEETTFDSSEKIESKPPIDETTETPFELMVYGNMSRPLFDRRKAKIEVDSSKLLCDFSDDFDCQWGVEEGKWAVIERGAIPNLDSSITDPSLLPNYPAALVIQGVAKLESDPILCLSGPGKLLFRYWSNSEITLKVCAASYDNPANRTVCVNQSQNNQRVQNLAVFNFPNPIYEPFTLQIVPQWSTGYKNRFLVIDEIAYIGECNPENRISNSLQKKVIPTTETTAETTTTTTTTTTTQEPTTELVKSTWIPIRPYTPRSTSRLVTLRPLIDRTSNMGMRKLSLSTTLRPIPMATTSIPIVSEDYCTKLNCNFEESACNYLNHGLTKKPWTLRNRGYGYPLTGATDIRPNSANGQFVAAVLNSGDVAIMESPKFNATNALNVLLFQYYRPSPLTTIRLCLGSRYSSVYRSLSSFNECPSVLRSITSRIAHNWNTVHIQLPSGTTHFYIVATNNDKSDSRTAVAIDNIRVAMCDSRSYSPDYTQEASEDHNFLNGF
ncbi:unnamed protein product [Auanema sp. JU1783]|nr:unnamed protein product [Auanema sp. JU1783]